MTTPAEPPRQPPERPPQPEQRADSPVDLGKHDDRSAGMDPNDPYRFGLPDTPPPPEYAPPGWTPPAGWPPPRPPQSGQPAGPGAGQPPPGPYGQPPYAGGPPPYPGGQPPYPGWQQHDPGRQPYPQAPGRGREGVHRRAVAALVLGIVSIPGALVGFLDVVLVIAALIFGSLVLGARDDRHDPDRRNRRLAIAGIICAGVGALAAIGWTLYVVHLVNNCGGFNQPNSPALRACLQRQL